MKKITADHLGRGAFVYVRQSTADQLLHNPESRRRQYGLADPGSSAGPRSKSSTMISAAPEVASIVRASSACWRRFVMGGSVPCLRSRLLGWLGTAATGTR
jgi:hypothetical protein